MVFSHPAGRHQLFLQLQERIERGHYEPGSWLPAERALAQEFGADRSAVRRVLAQLEDQGLIVREAGRRPWVRSLPLGRGQEGEGSGPDRTVEAGPQTIVAILPQHPIYPASLAIMHGINAALRLSETPFRLQVIDTHGGSESRETSLEKNALTSVIRERAAGVVLWHLGGEDTLPQLRELERRGTPIVFVDRCPPAFSCDFVGGDNQAGVEAAIEYLRDLGHRRIAHLTTDEQSTAVQERLLAYKEGMASGDITPKSGWICRVPHDSTSNVASACDQLLKLAEPPTAVLAMNDALAYYFISECQRRGLEVPRDFSVIGFDDLEQHSPRPPMLTTLHQSFDKIGRRAADLLLRRLASSTASREPKQHILVPTPLVVRSTCRPV